MYLLQSKKSFIIDLLRRTKMLMQAKHWDELVKDEHINIRTDYKNSGVGSNSCGSELLEKYRLSEKKIHFEFFIK